MTVNGTLEFQKTGPATPEILHGHAFSLVIDGTGTIVAHGSAGHSGRIANVSGSVAALEFESGITVKGSITIESDNSDPGMKVDGTFVVDNAADIMTVGVFFNFRELPITGSGTFEVSAGEMKLTSDMIPSDAFTGTHKVTGGMMRFSGSAAGTTIAHTNFVVEGGTLRFERRWVSTGSIVFTGGAIEVKRAKRVRFLKDE